MNLNLTQLPAHIAIIMDGNGRWAKQRQLPRYKGHQAGKQTVKTVIQYLAKLNVQALTLFTFSSENWRRPKKEVDLLMKLFADALAQEVEALHQNQIRLQIIGDRTALANNLQQAIIEAEQKTYHNTGMRVVLAVNYGGRWDLVNTMQGIARQVKHNQLAIDNISEQTLSQYVALADLPEPDLFIRTGGEQRISNFLLWQLAYTELYFTDCFWPDFGTEQLQQALQWFDQRQRRFGYTPEQIKFGSCNE